MLGLIAKVMVKNSVFLYKYHKIFVYFKKKL